MTLFSERYNDSWSLENGTFMLISGKENANVCASIFPIYFNKFKRLRKFFLFSFFFQVYIVKALKVIIILSFLTFINYVLIEHFSKLY